MSKWEIKVLYLKTQKLGRSEEGELNALCDQGWEPYAAHADAGGVRHYFKRPVGHA